MEIKGAVGFVTGGASGLGAATVEMLYQNGAKAIIENTMMNGETIRLGVFGDVRAQGAGLFDLCIDLTIEATQVKHEIRLLA